MNPFMKPLYQEFEGNLYRFFNATLEDFREAMVSINGKLVDEEFEELFLIDGPHGLRKKMNLYIILFAVLKEEHRTGKSMSFSDMEAYGSGIRSVLEKSHS